MFVCHRNCALLSLTPPAIHFSLHSFPTRRSSDLSRKDAFAPDRRARPERRRRVHLRRSGQLDRKSTRLNSSHVAKSYAVFCLKKKNIAKFYGVRNPTSHGKNVDLNNAKNERLFHL